MPEFIAQHVPSDLDQFTTGYLEAVEWLLDEETNRYGLEGFSESAILRAKEDCRSFQESYAEQLAAYEEYSGRSMSSAGTDFYLSRNGHGAGFFDRGNQPVFDELQKLARIEGETYHEVGSDNLVYQL